MHKRITAPAVPFLSVSHTQEFPVGKMIQSEKNLISSLLGFKWMISSL